MEIKDSYIANNKNLLCRVSGAVVHDNYLVEKKYLPVDKIGVLVAADYYDDEMIMDLMVTRNNKGDLTIPNVHKFFERIIWSNLVDYYSIMNKISLNSHYMDGDKTLSLIENELNRNNVRLNFDDGG